MNNLILNTDSYKISHFLGYPEGTTEMYSYLESRGGQYDQIVFVGLQPILDVIEEGIYKEDIAEAKRFAEAHGEPFNEEGWQYIMDNYGGALPVEIRALPEGTIAKPGIPLMTVRSMDPKCAWLTSYLETMLLRVWYPTTVASRIFKMKENIRPYFEDTTNEEVVSPFAILDFSSRGVSSLEQSKIGGFAYLTMFLGSDNVPAVDFTNKVYMSDMSGFSVPATEHSIMCAFEQENEEESFKYLLDKMGTDGGILSVVSDTWNIYEAVDKWIKLQKEVIKKNVTLVIRPDSGEIGEVLPTIFKKLVDEWPYKINQKGYIEFDNLKVLWGDGINEDTGYLPFHIAKAHGISANSIMTGSGGGLMQSNIDRDTCKFAIKGSNAVVKGKSIPISKDPITDKGKRSKAGKFSVIRGDNGLEWVNHEGATGNLLEVVYRPDTRRFTTIDEIRKRIENNS